MGSLIGLVAGAIILIVVAFLLKGALAKAGQAKVHDLAAEESHREMRARLEAIAPQVAGSIVDGPALQTAQGKLVLMASGAPKTHAIDVAKFTSPLPLKAQLTLIPAADAAKALVTKNLHPVVPDDPAIAAEYKLFSSDDALGRKVAVPQLIERMKELDKAVRGRARLQVAPSGATVLVTRGLSAPDELKAFYDRSVAIIDFLKSLPGGGS